MCQSVMSCFPLIASLLQPGWKMFFFYKATQIVVSNDVVGVVAIVMSSANYVPDDNFSS